MLSCAYVPWVAMATEFLPLLLALADEVIA
jgi:hypothetical protein